MTTIPDLIKRLEAAEGASYELEARIWCALNGKKYAAHHAPEGSGVKRLCIMFKEPPKRGERAQWVETLYTHSIDAALTLVPEGYFISMGHNPDPDDDAPSAYGALLHRYFHVADKSDAQAVGGTMAIALTIACLKARLDALPQ